LRFIVSSIALFVITISQRTLIPNKKDFLLFFLLGFVLFINHISLNYGFILPESSKKRGNVVGEGPGVSLMRHSSFGVYPARWSAIPVLFNAR
jgi:hypothetical protein